MGFLTNQSRVREIQRELLSERAVVQMLMFQQSSQRHIQPGLCPWVPGRSPAACAGRDT